MVTSVPAEANALFDHFVDKSSGLVTVEKFIAGIKPEDNVRSFFNYGFKLKFYLLDHHPQSLKFHSERKTEGTTQLSKKKRQVMRVHQQLLVRVTL